MRIKARHRRWNCFFRDDNPPRRLEDRHEVGGPPEGGVELTVHSARRSLSSTTDERSSPSSNSRARRAESTATLDSETKEDEDLFKHALRLLEIAKERELSRDRGGSSDTDSMSVIMEPSVDEEQQHTPSDSDEDDELPEGEEVDDDRPRSRGSRSNLPKTSLFRGRLGPRPSIYTRLTEEELQIMLNQLQRRKLPEPNDALRLVEQVRDHLASSTSPLMRLPRPEPNSRIVIVGDLHGHLGDLLHVRRVCGDPLQRNKYIFNGDFVDRGVWGPEVVLTIFCMRLMYPDDVFLNRGNHESELCTEVYGFKAHLACAYPKHHEELYPLMLEAFDHLPLCHIIGDSVCVIHGGLPRNTVTLKDIEELPRGPVPRVAESEADLLFQALLWSDPKETSGPSERGMGWYFPEKKTKKFLELNELTCIVRSHECVDHGYQESHSSLVRTVFSASNYEGDNDACVAIVDSDLKVTMGTVWNQPYVKKKWLGHEPDIDFDASLLLDHADGFHHFEVQVQRSPGQKLGIHMSADHPLLEIPVIMGLDLDGAVPDYNGKQPEDLIDVGDAILEVNGSTGYRKILERLKADLVLAVKLRRPKRVTVRIDDSKGDLPPIDGLIFPEGDFGFAWATNGWEPEVQKFDRIIEINGCCKTGEMKRQLAEVQRWDLVLLRYAKEDLKVEPSIVRRERWLRQASETMWEEGGDEDEDNRAIVALRKRCGGDQWKCTKRERVLEELRRLVFMNRMELLENFQIADKVDTPSKRNLKVGYLVSNNDWTGRLSPERWAEVMQKTLNTPMGFPWYELRPHLTPLRSDGKVPYIRFLWRFRNKLVRWLIDQWCSVALDQLVTKLHRAPAQEFDLLDTEGMGKLSYTGLRPFVQKYLYPEEPCTRAEKRLQDLECFALFRNMDTEGTEGAVDKEGFVHALSRRRTVTARKCPEGHALEERSLRLCEGCNETRQCNDCFSVIYRHETRRWCDLCEYDLCEGCVARRASLDSQYQAKAIIIGVRRQAQWKIAEKVLGILCASHCDIRAVFTDVASEDEDPDVISSTFFVNTVSQLLNGDAIGARELLETVCDYLRFLRGQTPDDCAQPFLTLSVSDVVDCMRITDDPV